MKKVIWSLIAVLFVGGLIGVCGFVYLGPVVTGGTPVVKIAQKAPVVIMGTGFR